MAKASYTTTKGGSKNDWLQGHELQDDLIYGYGGNDYLFGYSGNDWLKGGDGNDRLYGGTGNDLLDGGRGADYFNGGSGNDTVTYENATSRVYVSFQTNRGSWGDAAGDTYTNIENVTASNYNDYVYGNNYANIIKGLGGRDILRGYGGDDIIDGGDGNDTIWGGANNDTLIAGAGTDTLYGEAGNDTFRLGTAANQGFNTFYGGADDDLFDVGDTIGNTLHGGNGNDTASYARSKYAIYSQGLEEVEQLGTPNALVDTLIQVENLTGSNYADDIYGTDEGNVLRGLGGDDDINGGAGNDTIDGGDDDDTLNGGAGDDVIVGGAGDDTIIGGGSDTFDTLDGGAGNDIFIGAGDANHIDGGTGSDTVTYQFSTVGVEVDLDWHGTGNEFTGGGASNDWIERVENITGSNFDDELGGNFEANTLIGRAGNDIFQGSLGNDVIDGGDGTDTLIFEDYMSVTLNTGSGYTNVWIDNDTYVELGVDAQNYNQTVTGIENVDFGDRDDTAIGHGADNTFFGNGGDDSLYGMHGNDQLDGGDGDDYLHGQQDNDTLIGGTGADTLRGGWGDDVLWGSVGWDEQIHNSTVVGDGSTDTFVFDEPILGPENDRIMNFIAGEDKIDFSNFSAFNSFDDVMDAATIVPLSYDNGIHHESLILDTGDGGSIHLDYIAVASQLNLPSMMTPLSEGDFIF